MDVDYEPPAPAELHRLYGTHWWFEGRSLEDVRRSIEGSDECVALRDGESDRLVAAARVITDYVYTGKVLDVIVDGDLRGQGLGTRLMDAVTTHPGLGDLRELTLNCRAGLAPFYRDCGFEVHEMVRDARDGDGEDYYVMVHSFREP